MKICIVNLYYNVAAADESPTAHLERLPLLQQVPAALAAAGHEVDVVQLYPVEESLLAGGVMYHFVRPALLEKGAARIGAAVDGRLWTRHLPAMRAVRRVLSLQPDVVHFHRLTQSSSLYLMQKLRGNDGPAIVAQYHGGRLSDGWLEHKIQRAGLNQVQRALFARREDAAKFLEDSLLQEAQIVEMTDRSTELTMKPRPEARAESGMQGSPVFLWYSNLEPERDPMTAVLGFRLLMESWPKAQLYMYYDGDELLTQMRAYVIAHPELAGHVHIHSQQSGQPREMIFNSADYLLQTDRKASNGHALLDAMACGVIPVLSDIPPYRAMIDNGRCGFLFPQGDVEAMAKQLLKISSGKIAGRAALVHDWFEAAYSYDAMAGLLLDIYTEAIGERRAQVATSQEPVAEGSS